MPKHRIPSDYKNQTPSAMHNWHSGAYGPFHPGLAIPVHHRHLNDGERIRGSIQDLVQSNPMLGPLMNGFKQVTIATFLPDSAIYGWMRNGKRYTPAEYQSFGKVYFSPTGSDYAAYKDPVFNRDRYSRRLKYGLTAKTVTEGDDQTPLSPYALWVRDELVPASNPELRHVGRGGLWDWLGVPAAAVAPRYGSAGNTVSSAFKWQLAPYFAYVLSHYYYIANMQEDNMYFTRGYGDIAASIGYKESTQVPFDELFASFLPNNFLDLLDQVGSSTRNGAALDIWSIANTDSYRFVTGMLCAGLQAHGGFLSVPYSPDLFGNIIKQGSSPSVDIMVGEDPNDPNNVTGYVVAIPELRLKTKIQNWFDRLFVSGGRWGDVMRTLWGTNSSPYINKPDFLGVWQSSINPSNVVATANGSADGESANVGQMAARIDKWSSYNNKQGVDYYAKEPGTFMLITMLVPEVAYCQGLHPDLGSISFADDYNPELAGIGFTSVPRWRFSMMPEGFKNYPGAAVAAVSPWFDNGNSPNVNDPNSVSVGEEVAWSWLRTDYPRLYGEFAQNGMYQYWVMPRRFTDYYYESGATSGGVETGGIYSDYSYYGTYISPLAWQYLFVGQSMADPNFFYYGTYDLRVTSSLPANYMPYLGR